MRYSIEIVTQSSQRQMLTFLKEHENNALFLLGNFENYGAILTDAPYSENFKPFSRPSYRSLLPDLGGIT